MAPSAARHHVTSAFTPFALHSTGQSGLAQTGYLTQSSRSGQPPTSQPTAGLSARIEQMDTGESIYYAEQAHSQLEQMQRERENLIMGLNSVTGIGQYNSRLQQIGSLERQIGSLNHLEQSLIARAQQQLSQRAAIPSSRRPTFAPFTTHPAVQQTNSAQYVAPAQMPPQPMPSTKVTWVNPPQMSAPAQMPQPMPSTQVTRVDPAQMSKREKEKTLKTISDLLRSKGAVESRISELSGSTNPKMAKWSDTLNLLKSQLETHAAAHPELYAQASASNRYLASVLGGTAQPVVQSQRPPSQTIAGPGTAAAIPRPTVHPQPTVIGRPGRPLDLNFSPPQSASYGSHPQSASYGSHGTLKVRDDYADNSPQASVGNRSQDTTLVLPSSSSAAGGSRGGNARAQPHDDDASSALRFLPSSSLMGTPPHLAPSSSENADHAERQL